MRRCSLRFLVRLILPAADPDEDNQRAGDTTCAKKERATTTNCYLIVDTLRYNWYLRANTILEQNGIVYETNSFGLRDVEFSLVEPEGTLRIVCWRFSDVWGRGFV